MSDSPDLASEILENLELNRKTHGLANASVTASTLIGAALRFIVETFGTDAAGREVATMREALEATIRFSGIQKKEPANDTPEKAIDAPASRAGPEDESAGRRSATAQ